MASLRLASAICFSRSGSPARSTSASANPSGVSSTMMLTPVIASNLGAMSSLIEHGRTGLHFEPGHAEELASQVQWFWAHPDDQRRMRRETRAAFEATFTAEQNYKMLMAIYETAMARARRRGETV